MGSEKEFLHKLANVLGLAYGMVELALDGLKANGDPESREAKQLEKGFAALDQLTEMVKTRRRLLEQLEGQG